MTRVAIDARMLDGSFGGVQTVVAGIAQGFSDLTDDGTLQRTWLTFKGEHWLDELRPVGDGLLEAPRPHGAWRSNLAGRLGPRTLGFAKAVRERVVARPSPQIDLSSGSELVDGLNLDLVHFPFQHAFLTRHPTIYQPHDLQHLHFPAYFDRAVIEARERSYRRFCDEARYVVVGSNVVREDVISFYGVHAERVVVIPLAPNRSLTNTLPVDPGGLPARFLLYPAVAWPHKNHENLLRGFALIAASHPSMHLVLCGAHTERTEGLRNLARSLGISDRVAFLGRVSDSVLAHLYRRATVAVVPTLFEAGSFPVWEAFQFGVPVACSDIPALRAQARDCAEYFGPHDPAALAAAVSRLLDDGHRAAQLKEAGLARMSHFTWELTARGYRSVYRAVTGEAKLHEDPDWSAVQAVAF